MQGCLDMTARRIVIAAAVNDRVILENCLGRSPDIRSGEVELVIYEGCPSASKAYNRALDDAGEAIVVLAHQDVYLPRGFIERLYLQLARVEETDPDWAVLVSFGLDHRGRPAGRVWSTSWGRVFEGEGPLPSKVITGDELLLIVRGDGKMRFDEELPGFHLYCSDMILEGEKRKRSSYAVDLPVIHHERGVDYVRSDYRAAYRYMARKWHDRLPLPNLCVPLSANPLVYWKKYWTMRINAMRGKLTIGVPTSNPAEIAKRLGFE
jgi:hypothetical protein